MMRTGHHTARAFSPGELLAVSDEVARAGAGVRLEPASTEVVLLAIDPSRAHAYWHVEVPDLNRARRETGRSYAPMLLRVFRLRGREPEPSALAQEHEVRLLQGSAYLEGLEPGAAYRVVLGLARPDGTLAHLAASAPAALPPSEPSARRATAAIDTRESLSAGPALTDLAVEVTGPPREVPLPRGLSPSPEREGSPRPASGGQG